MQIKIGYEIIFDCPKQTPIILSLNVHYSRVSDLVAPDHVLTTPSVPIEYYRDIYGNWLCRLVAPKGQIRLYSDAIINDSGKQDTWPVTANKYAVEDLPNETLVFLLGSRYCETELFGELAWKQFGHISSGLECVNNICNFVHNHITFDYSKARATKTAWDVYNEGEGVCRDYTHLAITLCRCVNIPARYCMGYLSDIGVPPPHGLMDFAAWMEVYLEGGWHVFDPRNNKPCIGRIPLAKGRDAADVAISNSFGPNELKLFKVWTDEYIQDQNR
jgi:transglutaminase-like putative cysteine protease